MNRIIVGQRSKVYCRVPRNCKCRLIICNVLFVVCGNGT